MTVEERIALNAKNKDIEDAPNGSFGKSMPPKFDADSVLEVGDVIQIPNPLPKVQRRKFGVNAAGEVSYGEFITVNVQHPVNAALGITVAKPDRAVDFFPSSFTKNIWRVKKNEQGEVETITEGGPLNPLGTATAMFLSFQGQGTETMTDTQMGMNALAGQSIKVTAKVNHDSQAWRNGVPVNSLRKTAQFTYDL